MANADFLHRTGGGINQHGRIFLSDMRNWLQLNENICWKEFLEILEMFCNIFADAKEEFLVEQRLQKF